MKNITGTKNWSLTILLAFILLWAPSVKAVTPASWKDTGMTLNASGMKLREVLQEFARTYGVRLSSSINDNRVVSGRLKAPTGSEFIERLAQEYRFRWFVYNDTLYVTPNDDNVSMRLEVGEDAVQDAKAALTGVGLFESRFGWGELPDEGVVVVGGPRVYANMVRDLLMPADSEKKAKSKEKQIMVFRLKYASATDRVIETRGKQDTIPGIKTILSNLLDVGSSSSKKGGSVSSFSDFTPSSSKPSRQSNYGRGRVWEGTNGKPLTEDSRNARNNNNADEDVVDERSSSSSRKSSSSREERPRIEADASLNAIMIYDTVNKRAMYQALINELDIEPQQIEIEALIVDIDRSKLAEMGVEWGVTSPNGNNNYTMNSTTGDSSGSALPLPGSTLLISNAARFYARLHAMESTGDARVLAKPTVLTLENVAAVLDLSQTAYVSLVGERVADLADVTAGTMLRVVPRIVHEGASSRVRLDVDIEDGSLNNDPSLKSGSTSTTISTQAIIEMQQTLMIGGYHADSMTVNNQKVPLLGDVPVLGNLFRSTSRNYSTKERLFLITPRIAGLRHEPEGYATATPEQQKKALAAMQRAAAATAAAQAASVAPVASASAPAPVAATPAAPTAPAAPLAETFAVTPSQTLRMESTLSSTQPAQPRATKKKCARPKGVALLPGELMVASSGK
jgi:type III secretion protein C